MLYGLLLVNLLLHRLYGLPNLSPIVLLLPLAFLPYERLGIKSWWNLSLLVLPFLYMLHKENFLALSLQAFAEELFFRAYLMQRLTKSLTSSSVAPVGA